MDDHTPDHSDPSTSAHPFAALTPDFIMDAVESRGWRCDGRILALNSYENRVYQVGIEDGDPLIAKFYRPGRWSDAQILEEHAFCFELAEQELPVVPPLGDGEGQSLHPFRGQRFSLFMRKGGHAPEIDHGDNLSVIGRFLARIHRVGERQPYRHRPGITLQTHAIDSVERISNGFMPAELMPAYSSLTRDLLDLLQQRIDDSGSPRLLRVHGDCHAGNMLWRDDHPHFVDFDDSRQAPAIQDLWMLLSGDRDRQQQQLSQLIAAYEQFRDFDYGELQLIEVFRSLRILHYSAWLARRWDDPAFPRSFPWFNTQRYWEEHILELREQFAALQEPPLCP